MLSKERQRAELHKSIWRIANDVRRCANDNPAYKANLNEARNAEIARIVARQAELRIAIDAIVADLEATT